MSDVSGIPNMGFGGGGYFGGNAATGQPAMSAAQINAGIWGNYSPQQAQATFNQISGGLTQDPARYAAIAAAYGRQVAPSSPAAVAASNPNYQPSYGGWGGADDYLNDNPDVRQHAIDNALNAHDFAYQHASTYGANEGRNTYNAPRQYGWMPNEGAPAPAAPQVFNKGEFNPQTYGWDHNEGATASPWEGAGFDAIKYLNAPGNEDLRAANVNPWQHALNYGFNEHRQGMGWNPVDYLNQNIDVKNAGVNPWEHAQNFGFKEGRAGLEGLTQTDAGRNALAKLMTEGAPKSGVVGGWYDPYGGGGGYPQQAPAGRAPAPVQSQDWNSTFNNMVNGSGGNPYALGGATWYPSGGGGAYGAAQDMLRAGRGWTIADTPSPASQGGLANRINQGIYDIGNAGDAYSRAFGMNLPSGGQGTLSLQDLTIPHAYPPGFRR